MTIKKCIEIRQILSGRNTSQYVSIVFITRCGNTFTHRVIVVDVQDTKRSPSFMRRNYLETMINNTIIPLGKGVGGLTL